MRKDPMGEQRPHLGDPKRMAQIDARLVAASKRRCNTKKIQHPLVTELRRLRATDPMNFWAMVMAMVIVVGAAAVLTSYWLGRTLSAVVAHDNGWQLVWQSLVETYFP